jgi:hypothetical protein
MPVMVSHPAGAKTNQRDETSDEQDANYLQRPCHPTIHFRDLHNVNRQWPVDDLERIASIDKAQ